MINNFLTCELAKCPPVPTDAAEVEKTFREIIEDIDLDIKDLSDHMKKPECDAAHKKTYTKIVEHLKKLKIEKKKYHEAFKKDKNIKKAWDAICKLLKQIEAQIKATEDAHGTR